MFCIGSSLAASLNMPDTLYIYTDRLVIRALRKGYAFPRAAIIGLHAIRVLFWRLIQIEHSIPEESSFVAFRPFSFPEVQQRLANAGFPSDSNHWHGCFRQRCGYVSVAC